MLPLSTSPAMTTWQVLTQSARQSYLPDSITIYVKFSRQIISKDMDRHTHETELGLLNIAKYTENEHLMTKQTN